MRCIGWPRAPDHRGRRLGQDQHACLPRGPSGLPRSRSAAPRWSGAPVRFSIGCSVCRVRRSPRRFPGQAPFTRSVRVCCASLRSGSVSPTHSRFTIEATPKTCSPSSGTNWGSPRPGAAFPARRRASRSTPVPSTVRQRSAKCWGALSRGARIGKTSCGSSLPPIRQRSRRRTFSTMTTCSSIGRRPRPTRRWPARWGRVSITSWSTSIRTPIDSKRRSCSRSSRMDGA